MVGLCPSDRGFWGKSTRRQRKEEWYRYPVKSDETYVQIFKYIFDPFLPILKGKVWDVPFFLPIDARLPENMEQHPVDKAPVVPGPEQEQPILEPHHLS